MNIPEEVKKQIEAKWPVDFNVLAEQNWILSAEQICARIDSNKNCREAAEFGYGLAQPQWISVKERLPEKGERVILYGEMIGVSSFVAFKNINNIWKLPDGSKVPFKDSAVTHWMPLPEPPKV